MSYSKTLDPVISVELTKVNRQTTLAPVVPEPLDSRSSTNTPRHECPPIAALSKPEASASFACQFRHGRFGVTLNSNSKAPDGLHRALLSQVTSRLLGSEDVEILDVCHHTVVPSA